MDLSKLSDSDLLALQSGNLSKMSDAGLQLISGQAAEPVSNPTTGMSGTDKFLSGMGKAGYDIARGIGTIVTDAFPQAAKYGFATRADVDAAKKLDAPLMNTGAGIAGNITGNVALAAPTTLIPGANTVTGAGLVGAGLSALQPVGTEDSRSDNMKMGFVTGAAVPLAINAVKAAKALTDPITKSGQKLIIGRTLNKVAGNPAQAIQNMETTTGATAGFLPTAAQAADDAGIAAAERTARAIDPGGFDAIDKSQRGALVDAVRGIAQTPEARAAADSARENAANNLYGQAYTADAMRRDLANSAAQARAPFVGAGLNGATENLSTPQLRKLATRPAFQDAMQQAITIAKNKGVDIGNPTQSLQGLHYIKLALDDMANPGAATALGRNANAGVNDIRNALTAELEQISPLYGNARQTFSEMSRPINQMDVGQALYDRFVPALAEGQSVPFKSNANALATALRNGDNLAKTVTGWKGATLNNIMSPEQMNVLNGVVQDAQMKAAAETAGRGVGSDTFQKMAMNNLIEQAGIPTWAGNVPVVGAVGGKVAAAAHGIGNLLYTSTDNSMQNMLSDILKDPKLTAEVMRNAAVQPSKLADILRRTAQSAGVSATATLPAVMNAE